MLPFISVLIVMSCARSANPDIERGSSYIYQRGYPDVRFSAVGFLNELNNPHINIIADIVYGSMIFTEVENKQQAQLSIEINIASQEDENNIIERQLNEITIKEENEGVISSQQSYIYEKRIEVPAGKYKVSFTVTDQNSDKKITRTSEVSIPDPESNQVDLTGIRMLGKNMDVGEPDWYPIATYSVPGRVDSLMFIFQATNTASDQPLSINASLIRFDSDTSIAEPMSYSNYSPSSVEYKGIELDDKKVIQQSQRKLLQEGSVFIEFKFAQQERGNYRFEVQSNKQDSDLYKAREFAVKSANYPTLKTARELAGPLAYLMGDDEYEELISIKNPDSLKNAIDRFWLKNIGNRIEAKQVIDLYYKRAEEANKQFSNFKEGWKTDIGMIYILFGPPWYVYTRLDQTSWSYAYDRNDPERNFQFFQPNLKSEFYPFQHYVLQRQQEYFNVEYRQRQLWLTGLILQRRL
jgi:GWxTD domain-containing protein